MTGNDIREYFKTHDWFKYCLLWEDRESGEIYQADRCYISIGGSAAERRWRRTAIKYNATMGGSVDCHGLPTTLAIEEILFESFDKIADWLTNSDTKILKLSKYMPNMNMGIYYTPDGARHATYDYFIWIHRAPKAPLGFVYSMFDCDYPEWEDIKDEYQPPEEIPEEFSTKRYRRY